MNALTILSIDTSGKTASVALTRDGRLLGETSIVTRLTHSQVILPMVQRLLDECETDISEVGCVAAANGPGSYTGLRIGIGAVKGMCLGRSGLKCAGVSTLLALAYNVSAFEGNIYTVLRARNTICYFAAFISKGGRITRAHDDCLMVQGEVCELIRSNGGRAMLIGDYAMQLKAAFKDDDSVILAPDKDSIARASSIAAAVEGDETLITTPEALGVSYLQPTKAQKDRAHSKES